MFKQRVSEGIESISFEVHLPGDEDDKPSARIEAVAEQIMTGLPPPSPDNDDPFLQIMSGIIFNPLELRQEGKIQVSVLKAGKRYRLGSLRVQSAPQPNQEAAN